MRSWVDLKGDNLQISRAYLRITVGLQIFVYKLLQKVTKHEETTQLKLTNGMLPLRSAPFRNLLCPYSVYILHSLYTDLLTI